jgi:murein DD-endopeptidase MepM/ murein hydrolase activator NlpD
MTARVLMDFLHLKQINAIEGTHYHVGDVLAVQDNTGFSTGPHTHIQPRRVTWDGITITTLDKNDANNSFDPTKFWNGFCATQATAVINNLDTQLSLAQKVVTLLTQWVKQLVIKQ